MKTLLKTLLFAWMVFILDNETELHQALGQLNAMQIQYAKIVPFKDSSTGQQRMRLHYPESEKDVKYRMNIHLMHKDR